MNAIDHEEHIGYSRFAEDVEQAETFLDEAGISIAAEHWAETALVVLGEAAKLLANDGPRGRGARMAEAYRVEQGLETVEALRLRALSVQFGAAEASAVTGGLVEEAEA